MTFSRNQLVAALTVLVLGVGLSFFTKDLASPSPLIFVVALIGAIAVVFGGSGGGAAPLHGFIEAARRAATGESPSVPPQASGEALRLYEALVALAEQQRKDHSEFDAKREQIAQYERTLEEAATRLDGNAQAQLGAAGQTARLIKDLAAAVDEVANHLETLTQSAEESSSSILEMTATNDEVAENVGELAGSVRETVSSIEEMAYSIKEVAKNVDALSLTAEETSSSMNQMDVSIDQVQSNANETARLSEEVALDAEKGAEAILKTISEIYRIKESSQEAVSVISNLGSRIEAIGQIVNVIDDVAEQTNLLALNAAIIAAQAGEQGKGFAVVADEIKDLAERAGASTREITDLIKTVQAESKNAIAAVERGAHNVDRGVEVSNEAERALKKILESSQKSTNMVRAIARATVEQAKGSKQVTDAIGRIAETVQQIAAATAEQARGSELIMKSAEKMRVITQHVERSSQEQAKGGRQISNAIENISSMVNQLNASHKTQSSSSQQLLVSAGKIEESSGLQQQSLKQLLSAIERLKRASESRSRGAWTLPSSSPPASNSRTDLVSMGSMLRRRERCRGRPLPPKIDDRPSDRRSVYFGRDRASPLAGRGAVLTYGDDPRRRDREGIGRKTPAF
jgi:methyl-accepting chemotaxis protein